MNDDDWEEETLMVVELKGIIDSKWIANCPSSCKLVGIDTDNPFLQFDRYVFSGEYQDIPGTFALFEKEQISDGCDVDVNLKYHSHTCKKLVMTRAFLTEKEEEKSIHDASMEESLEGEGLEGEGEEGEGEDDIAGTDAHSLHSESDTEDAAKKSDTQ